MPKHINHKLIFYGGLTLVFLLSRMMFHEAGVRFDAKMLSSAWQILDLNLLKDDLIPSIWYLHAQPPLYNLLIGLVLKVSFGHEAQIFAYLYLGLGLAVALMLGDALRRLGVVSWLAFLLVVLFCCSPAAILYENWIFYTQLEVFGMTGITWAAVRVFKTGAGRTNLLLLFGTIAGLCLTRSLYHWLFFLMLSGWVWVAIKEKMRVLYTALPAFLLVIGWYTKNFILFGSFSASTWFGMNFARLSYNPHTELGKIGMWKPINTYDSLLHFGPSPYPNAVVSAPLRSSGDVNFNHYGYIQVAQAFGREAKDELKRNPTQYRDHVARAFQIYFEPPSLHRFDFLEPNHSKLGTLNRYYNYGYTDKAAAVGNDLLAMNMLLYFLVCWGGILIALWATDPGWRKTAVFLLLAIGFVTVVGCLFEIHENNRFRFPTMPMILILAGMEIQILIRFLGHSLGHRGHREDTESTEKQII